jgi:hypothetical protein
LISFDENELFRLTFTSGVVQGGLLGADDRIILGFFIDLKPRHIFLGYRHIRKNGFYRALGKARIAIDTGIGVDQELIGQLMKRLNGAYGSTVRVFTFDTRFGNDVGHLLTGTPLTNG